MKKESPKPLSKSEVRNLETSHLNFPDRERASESSSAVTFSWLEDLIIQKRASIQLGKDPSNNETVTIKAINPKNQKEEVLYYTAAPKEVSRFKQILKGKTIVEDLSADEQ